MKYFIPILCLKNWSPESTFCRWQSKDFTGVSPMWKRTSLSNCLPALLLVIYMVGHDARPQPVPPQREPLLSHVAVAKLLECCLSTGSLQFKRHNTWKIWKTSWDIKKRESDCKTIHFKSELRSASESMIVLRRGWAHGFIFTSEQLTAA